MVWILDNNTKNYPALVLKKTVVFPTEKISLVLEGEEIKQAVKKAHQKEHLLVLIFQKNGDKSEIGVLSKVEQHSELTPTIIGLFIEGLRRVKIKSESIEDDIRTAEIEELPVEEIKNEQEKNELEALSRNALDQFKKIIQMEGYMPFVLMQDLQREYISPAETSFLISQGLRLDFPEKINLLETNEVRKRLEILNDKLKNEINIAKTEQKIQDQMERDVGQAQKEFILRERLKAIEKELGIFEEQKEYDDLEKKIIEAKMPEDAEKKIIGELGRLRKMTMANPEASYIRTYIEWVSDLPWSIKSEELVDLKKAREVLDQDHYGLKKAKERVLEYLAVQKLTKGKGLGSILCFVGPPGTGKTSVGQSIARALNRKFTRISLGGIRDEAEIRGHRRTYVGALPGRIIQGMRTAGTKNPVFMLDEIDKLGADFRGDPSSALLEVLDPRQNNSFSDHYIEIPFDLSEVFFITTANILDPIPPALRDRMEVIEFPGYTEEEKFKIAKRFLLKRVLDTHGLNENSFSLTDSAIRKIISRYTREAGVRELERKIAEIARKIALQTAEEKQEIPSVINESNLSDYLGPEEYEVTVREEQDEIGVATGLAWTPVGGEIIFIEATRVPGKGNLILTGQLGEVMQESAKAALTYIRTKHKEFNFPEDFYYKSDIHIHVPSGAIPKDGPSAGIAIATALFSMVTGRKIRKEVALTGEITLSGHVLKVGGIKEKVLAANRGGVKVIVLPKENEKNLVDVPEEIQKGIEFKFVNVIDEAIKNALI